MDLHELSNLCDLYQACKKLRLDQEKVAVKTKEIEDEYKRQILAELVDAEVPSVGGTTHNFQRKVTNEPFADDWDEIYEYIYDNKAWELLHKRLGAAAVKERWDAGEEVPGVGAYPVETLSVTKLK